MWQCSKFVGGNKNIININSIDVVKMLAFYKRMSNNGVIACVRGNE